MYFFNVKTDFNLVLSFYILQNNIEGYSGEVKFDNEGFRSDFTMEIIELTEGGLTKIGTWSSKDGAYVKRNPKIDENIVEGSLQNVHFRIITALVIIYLIFFNFKRILNFLDPTVYYA